ncbi:MAG: alpha/beta fold hydrolase [Chloroflexota bacterium]|nr:MAG: alpha/beta fold hydrolase [Chloroflexota bacterium]
MMRGEAPGTRRRRPGPWWWLVRITLALAVALIAVVAIDAWRGGVTAIWLRYVGAAAYGAPGERVEIAEGHALYLDCRGGGSPTLVLDAGMSSDSATWSPIHDELARMTRTCAYDRTGRGRSDPGSAGDLAGMSTELRALLAAAGEAPPYVVVGHSFGAVTGRVFAAEAGDDVVGLVLVDGFDPDIFDERIVPLLGPLRDEYLTETADTWRMIASVEAIDVERSREQLAAADVSGRWIEAIIAPRVDSRLDGATNDAILASVAAGYEALSPGRVTFTPAWGSSHMVQFERPEVILDAVRRILAEVRG